MTAQADGGPNAGHATSGSVSGAGSASGDRLSAAGTSVSGVLDGGDEEPNFTRSFLFGHFLDARLEQLYVEILSAQWCRRLQVSFCALSLHFTLLNAATALKWTWHPSLLVSTLQHNGGKTNLHDLAPGMLSRSIYLPIVSICLSLCSFSSRLYRPTTFRWLIAAFILSAILCANLPHAVGYLYLESAMHSPLLNGMTQPTCASVPGADARCAAEWSDWREAFPRTTRVREEAASRDMATTCVYCVLIAAVPLPCLGCLVLCVFYCALTWLHSLMARRVLYGDHDGDPVSYTPFAQLSFLSVCVVYIARIRDNGERNAFISQRLLIGQAARKLEQLTQSKERAEYDRATAQTSLDRVERKGSAAQRAEVLQNLPASLQHPDRNLPAHSVDFETTSSTTDAEVAQIAVGFMNALAQQPQSDGSDVASEAESGTLASDSTAQMLSQQLIDRLDKTLLNMPEALLKKIASPRPRDVSTSPKAVLPEENMHRRTSRDSSGETVADHRNM